MTPRVQRLVVLVAGALTFGLTADFLLRAHPWGLGVALWFASLAACGLTALVTRTGERRGSLLLLGGAVLCAALLVWRDSPVLKALNLLAALTLLALAAGLPSTIRVWSLSLRDGVGVVFGAAARVAWQPLELLLSDLPRPGARLLVLVGPGVAVLRGAVLTAPLLLLFFLLFVSADAAFAAWSLRLLTLRLETLTVHVTYTGVFGWLSAGYLRSLVVTQPGPRSVQGPAAPRGALDVVTSLALLDLLFLAFVLVQARYLFGGASLTEAGSTMTHAAYARRGFFELVTVAVLAFPTVLTTAAPADRAPVLQRRMARLLGGVLVVLVGVVIVSALQRLRLYTDAYGLTEARLYAAALIGWLTLCFALLGLGLARGRAAFTTIAALVPALLVLALLNVANPDGLIARVNVDRAAEGERFDPVYLTHLSADATPALVAALPHLSAGDRCILLRSLAQQRRDLAGDDLRVWSWSRHAARAGLTDLPPAADCGR